MFLLRNQSTLYSPGLLFRVKPVILLLLRKALLLGMRKPYARTPHARMKLYMCLHAQAVQLPVFQMLPNTLKSGE